MACKRRMKNPEDRLRKRSHAILGETVHQYFNLPGQYIGAIENEIPDGDNKEKKTDGSYIVKIDKIEMIINIEDESSGITKESLNKSFGYAINMIYAHKLPIYSVITTPIPLEKCEKEYYYSKTLLFKPKIISFNEFDGDEKLKKYENKTNKEEYFSNIEGYDLINIPRMYDKNNAEILEKVCILFSKMKMKDDLIKYELGKCLECVIHKYAKTLDDINRLEEVINMTKVVNHRKEFIKNIQQKGIKQGINQGRKQGIKQGIKQGLNQGIKQGQKEGEIKLARKIAETIGIEETTKITGISKEEILNKKI